MARVVGTRDGQAGFLGSMGVRFMIDGGDSGGGFSLVEHVISARALAAPLIGIPVRMNTATSRQQWHTFWNAGDAPVRLLEVISPAGFEKYFADLNRRSGDLNFPELFLLNS